MDESAYEPMNWVSAVQWRGSWQRPETRRTLWDSVNGFTVFFDSHVRLEYILGLTHLRRLLLLSHLLYLTTAEQHPRQRGRPVRDRVPYIRRVMTRRAGRERSILGTELEGKGSVSKTWATVCHGRLKGKLCTPGAWGLRKG